MSESSFRSLGGSVVRRDERAGGHVRYVTRQSELGRLLAFAGRSIDDVVNSDIAKRDVRVWYKTACQVRRLGEVHDLEKQWNGR